MLKQNQINILCFDFQYKSNEDWNKRMRHIIDGYRQLPANLSIRKVPSLKRHRIHAYILISVKWIIVKQSSGMVSIKIIYLMPFYTPLDKRRLNSPSNINIQRNVWTHAKAKNANLSHSEMNSETPRMKERMRERGKERRRIHRKTLQNEP